MIKVVAKTFALLEFVAVHAGRPVLPGEAAVALKLNQATTVRILRDLLELGYLNQISRNKGYVLGPMAQSVFARNHYRENLIRAAAPLVAQCAGATGESVVLAVMQGVRRYVLLHENRNPSMNIDVTALYYDDLYLTATGRILLAYAPPAHLEAVVKRLGAPGKSNWALAAQPAGLKRELALIRQAGYVAFHSSQTDLCIMSAPVLERGECIAALGLSFPQSAYSNAKHAKALAAVRRAAAAISKKMVVIRLAG